MNDKKTAVSNRLREAMGGASAANCARVLTCAAAVLHLTLTQIHVNALLKLESQICGLVMFLFVLSGLVALFESIRFKRAKVGDLILLLGALSLTLGFGGWLLYIYGHALAYQRAIKAPDVYRAVWLSAAVCGVYAVSAVLLIIDRIKGHRRVDAL